MRPELRRLAEAAAAAAGNSGVEVLEARGPVPKKRKAAEMEVSPSAKDKGKDKERVYGEVPMVTYTDSPRHASFDLPSPTRRSLDLTRLAPSQHSSQPLRRLGTSRSFSDLAPGALLFAERDAAPPFAFCVEISLLSVC